MVSTHSQTMQPWSAMPPLDNYQSEDSVTHPLGVSNPPQTMTPSESATPPLDSSQSEGSVTPPLSRGMSRIFERGGPISLGSLKKGHQILKGGVQ